MILIFNLAVFQPIFAQQRFFEFWLILPQMCNFARNKTQPFTYIYIVLPGNFINYNFFCCAALIFWFFSAESKRPTQSTSGISCENYILDKLTLWFLFVQLVSRPPDSPLASTRRADLAACRPVRPPAACWTPWGPSWPGPGSRNPCGSSTIGQQPLSSSS